MIKIAFFDVDGTLLKLGAEQPSPKTVEALKALQASGVLICMATGRSYPTVPKFEGVEFDLHLTFNGSYIRSEDTVIHKDPLHPADVRQILENLAEMNRAVAISNDTTLVTNGTDPELEQYFAFGNAELIITEDFDRISQTDLYQLMCSATKEEYEQILLGTTDTQITAWWDKAVDIIPKNSGKGPAIKAVLDYFGFSKEEAIAFGDGMNDLDMLQAVGTGVAMGNAKAEVKAVANVICKSVEEDGVYDYLNSQGLI